MALTDKLTAIADAIRGKTGGTDELTLDQMATEIAGIESDPVLSELTVTENGEYTPDEGVDGFSKVIANIAASGGGGIGATKFIDVDITVEASTTTAVTYTVDNLEFITLVENPANVYSAFSADEVYVGFITPKDITGTVTNATSPYNCTMLHGLGQTNYAQLLSHISYGTGTGLATQNYGIYGVMLTCTSVKDGKITGNMTLKVRHNSAGAYEVAAGTYNVQVWMLNDFDWGHA